MSAFVVMESGAVGRVRGALERAGGSLPVEVDAPARALSATRALLDRVVAPTAAPDVIGTARELAQRATDASLDAGDVEAALEQLEAAETNLARQTRRVELLRETCTQLDGVTANALRVAAGSIVVDVVGPLVDEVLEAAADAARRLGGRQPAVEACFDDDEARAALLELEQLARRYDGARAAQRELGRLLDDVAWRNTELFAELRNVDELWPGWAGTETYMTNRGTVSWPEGGDAPAPWPDRDSDAVGYLVWLVRTPAAQPWTPTLARQRQAYDDARARRAAAAPRVVAGQVDTRPLSGVHDRHTGEPIMRPTVGR